MQWCQLTYSPMKSLTSDQYVVTILEEIKIKKAWNLLMTNFYQIIYKNAQISQHLRFSHRDMFML